MALSCSIIPQVKNKKGEIVDSNLFSDIMSLTNERPVILDIYQRVTSSFFLTKNRKSLTFDENNEPTLESILKNFEINDLLGDSIENKLLKELKEDNKTYENTIENVKKLSEKASSFNRVHRLNNVFVAIPTVNDDNTISLSIQKATDATKAETERMEANMMLNDRIKSVLAENGFKAGSLDTLEERMNVNGLIDFSMAHKAAEGLIELIRLSKGHKGYKALPEEYAHFVIEAMSNDAFIQRSLNTLNNNQLLVKSILGDEYNEYIDRYDDGQLAREALGKLLTMHLLKNISTEGNEYKSLIDRTINRIKQEFAKLDDQRIIDEINSINEAMDYISKKAINPEVKFDKKNIKVSDILYNLDINKERLNKIINIELKRYDIYEKKLNKSKSPEDKTKQQAFKAKQLKIINDLRRNIANAAYNKAITEYLTDMSNTIESLYNRLEESIGSTNSIQRRAYDLNNIQDYIDSYHSVFKELVAYAADVDSPITDDVDTLISDLNGELNKLEEHTRRALLDLFAEFLNEYVTDEITTSDRQLISKEDLKKMLESSSRDVSYLGKWLSSVANVNDVVIKLADKAIKEYKENARRRVMEIIKTMNIAERKLENAGIHSRDFMFQKESDGSLSEFYVSTTDWVGFRNEKKRFFDEMNQKYGTNPIGKDANDKRRKIAKWFEENVDKNGLPNDKWHVDLTFNSKEEEEYYNTFMEIRDELIKLLPTDVYNKNPMLRIQMRKDFIGRLKANGLQNMPLILKEQLKDSFQRRANDPNALVSYGIEDFKGRSLMSLPVYFVEKLPEGQREVSTDSSSTLVAFANMAIEFDELSKIVDIMEVGRKVSESREIAKRKFNKPMVEQINVLASTIINDINKTETTNFAQMYNELLESQLYGKYAKEGDDILDGAINTKKAANVANKLTSLNQLAINFLAGVAALGTDSINATIEAIGGQFFKMKDLWHADKTYFKNIFEIIAETGDYVKSNKLNLFIDEFDIIHEYENAVQNKEYSKNRLLRIFNGSTLYLFMSMGSHFGETRVALALANATMLKDENDNKISLYDAYEDVWNDPNDHSLGKKLVLKKGVTQLNGDPVDREFLDLYKNRARKLNQDLFGIYNKQDINYLQKTALGSMAMLYRKHIMPAVQRRFKEATSDVMLDAQSEGYYRTGWRVTRKLINDLIETRDFYALFHPQLSAFEKSQCLKMIVELLGIFSLGILSSFAIHKDWDDKDNSYGLRLLAYQAKRIHTELTAFSPLGIFGEAWNIVKSPMAAINLIDDTIGILDVLNPNNWTEEIERGKFKGHSKAYKAFMSSPLVPMYGTIYRGLHPEETLQYFNMR